MTLDDRLAPGPLTVDTLTAELHVDRDVRSVPLVRACVRDVLDLWGSPAHVVEDAALLVTELVTNAVRHATGARVTVRLARGRGVLRCAVHDEGRCPPGGVSPPRPAPGLAEAGRGLCLVAALALRWGCEPEGVGGGTCVWFELLVEAGTRGPGR